MSRRRLDILLSMLGLVALSPLFVLVAMTVVWFDGRPILFRQKRIGRGGLPFFIYKFRTMRSEAGASLTASSDRRITNLGRTLRRLKLDELPQLWNVLKGDMALVGPRPEVEEYVRLYTPEQRKVLELAPGLADPASLKYFDESDLLARADDPHRLYVETVMPDKIRLSLAYAARANPALDVLILMKTVARCLLAF